MENVDTFVNNTTTAIAFDIIDDSAFIESKSAQFVNDHPLKSVMDFVFSLLVVVGIFSWLFPIIMLAIIIDSGFPVFFIQERVGLHGRRFKCLKFRSMKAYANTNSLYTPTAKKDMRVTFVGQFLRKTNLDELPQFINVLKGDMSIVGPRPHAIAFHSKYSEMVDDINIDRRHLVKPGITGLSQIKGYRGDVDDELENKRRTKIRIRFDLLYIQKWTPFLDMKIVWLTVWNMLSRDTKGH